MRDYWVPITLSALQVYYSGAVSMPECALRRQTPTHGTARLISERNGDWQTETMVLEGHTDAVSSIAFSSDGLCIVSGSQDYTIRIWDAVSGAALNTLEGHTSGVNSIAFSPNGLRIVSGSDDHTIRLWDAVSGKLQHTLESHTSDVKSVAFSSDGLRIVSGSDDCTFRLGTLSRLLIRRLAHHVWL
jgi:WD40 repeat protein